MFAILYLETNGNDEKLAGAPVRRLYPQSRLKNAITNLHVT